ncbi:MAG: hypothetical protein ABW073_09865 [Acidimicrobiia bacterium]
MLNVRRRVVSIVVVATALVVLVANPASASPVLADDDYKWFYWAGPLIGLSLFMLICAIGIGYYVRVMRPKYRGRRVS